MCIYNTCPHARTPRVLFIQAEQFFGYPSGWGPHSNSWARHSCSGGHSCLGPNNELVLSRMAYFTSCFELYFEAAQATGRSSWAVFEGSVRWWMGAHSSGFSFQPCLETCCVIIPKFLPFCLDSPICEMRIVHAHPPHDNLSRCSLLVFLITVLL